jgi:hypothetical protein
MLFKGWRGGNEPMHDMEPKVRILPAFVFVLVALFGFGGCFRTGVEYRPSRTAARLPGASVVTRSDASYRLIISPKLCDAPSRLWAIHARVETFDETPLRIGRDGAQLILADGTRARPLDQPRVVALLKRTEVGAGDITYAHQGASRHATGGLPDREKDKVRSEILATPFVAGELTRSHPLEGYIVVDAKDELASLEGAVLEVVATRLDDGTFVRRTYRFSAPSDAARANAATSGD